MMRVSVGKKPLLLLDAPSILDAMNNSVALDSIASSGPGVEGIDSPAEQRFLTALDAVTNMVPTKRAPYLLGVYLVGLLDHRRALANIDSRTLLSILQSGGKEISARLVIENTGDLSLAAGVAKRFNIPPSTLHNWKSSGRAIAYRADKSNEDIFPLAQFKEGGVVPWAKQIISAVGNGGPAFHFLMVPRKSLGGVSFSRAILNGNDVAAERIGKQLAALVNE